MTGPRTPADPATHPAGDPAARPGAAAPVEARVLHLSGQELLLATRHAPIGGVAAVDLGPGGEVVVDALDHRQVVGIRLDLARPAGVAIAEAYLGPSGAAVVATAATVTVVGGPLADALGEAATCTRYGSVDHPAQRGVWCVHRLLALARAEAIDPRLREPREGEYTVAASGLEAALAVGVDRELAVRVADAAQALSRRAPADVATRLDAVHRAAHVAGPRAASGSAGAGTAGRGRAPSTTGARASVRRARWSGPGRADLEVIPVIAQLELHGGVRLGPRTAVVLRRAGDDLTVTITDVVEFPRQDGRSPRRVHLRARAALGVDDPGRHIDEVRLLHDPVAATATATLSLHHAVLGDGRFVLLDIPGGGPPATAAECAAAIVRSELQRARLLDRLAVPGAEVASHWNHAVDAAALLIDGAQSRAYEAVIVTRRTRSQIDFAVLALRVRLDER